MLRAVADTHAVIWHLYDDPRLSGSARGVFAESAAAGGQVGISAISLAETLYFSEKRRIPENALQLVVEVIEDPRTVLMEVPLDRVVVNMMRQIDRQDVPELPDRIIAATARLYNVPLISRDREIRLSGVETIW